MPILFTRSSHKRTHSRHWGALVNAYGQTCYYCGEFATVIDHVIPFSYGGSDGIDNLVLSCSLCNIIADDSVFDTLEEKQSFILAKRRRKGRVTRAICTNCLLPFDYRVLSPSLFLCAECYDQDEGELKYSLRPSWQRWIELLIEAGVPVEAHREMKELGLKTRERKLVSLVQIAYYGLRE